ncbi:MAG: STAS domain-containing protein [Pyrinomonadaceae bacterium]|nr:STAS domain-containing protein [Phycisphaerales bacterium]
MRDPIGFNPFEDAFVGVRIEDEVAVATVMCSSVRERQAAILQQTLVELAKSHGGRVLLDLCGVGMLSTACIADFLALQEQCKQLGGKFVLFGLASELASTLRTAGVLKNLNLAADEHDARKQLQSAKGKPGFVRNLLRRKAA